MSTSVENQLTISKKDDRFITEMIWKDGKTCNGQVKAVKDKNIFIHRWSCPKYALEGFSKWRINDKTINTKFSLILVIFKSNEKSTQTV